MAASRLLSICFVVGMAFLTLARLAHADTVDDETRRIGKQLQCPVCSGAAVSDSPSELAGQMRSVIRAKVQAGESEEQIVAYFVERYGDGVLIEPPRRGFSLVVWFAPVGALLAGGFLVWQILRSWRRARVAAAFSDAGSPATAHRNGTAHADTTTEPSSLDLARAELDRFRGDA